MAMNPQNILSQLRMMSDQQLQQYAAMHKNDPFVFPLAFQESQTRKQMRSESQAMQPQQPKVVDQDLAQMAPEPQLPEDVGIGQLPAPNLQHFDDGGIVGYADGGPPVGYNPATGPAGRLAYENEPVLRMNGGGMVAFDEGGEVPRFNGLGGSFVGPQYSMQDFLRQMGISTQQFLASSPLDQKNIRDMYNATHGAAQAAPQTASAATAAQAATKPATFFESLKQGLGRIRPGGLAGWGLGAYHSELNPNEEAELAKRWQGAAFGHVPLDATDTSLGNVPSVPTVGASKTDAGSTDQGGKKLPPGPAAPTIAPTSFKPAEAPTIASAKELAGQLLDTGAYKSEIEKYQKAEQDAVNALRKAREEGKPQGKAYEEYEATLREETKDLGRQKGEAQGEAWLTAGLAVLGGSSPYALQNLGLATKGVEQYRDAMKDIRKATRENAKGLADIAQARRAEERGDWEKTQEFEERANTRMSNARKFGIEGLMSLGVKSAELAGRAYDTQVQQAGMDRRTMAELQSREKIAGAQLAAPSGIEKLVQRIQTDPKFAEAYEKYASIGPGVRGEYAALQKYMGPQGELSLRMLESGTPEQKAQAQAIRQRIRQMYMQPMMVPEALP